MRFMIEFDHVAIRVYDLDESINFYRKLGYQLQEQFHHDKEYKWATLQLGATRLEIFESLTTESSKIDHIAYNFDHEEEVLSMMNQFGYSKEELDIFYGDLNQKSFFIEDNSGLSIQFIKKHKNQ